MEKPLVAENVDRLAEDRLMESCCIIGLHLLTEQTFILSQALRVQW